MTRDTDDTEKWRKKAEQSENREWCDQCEKSYYHHFPRCPHCSVYADISASDVRLHNVCPMCRGIYSTRLQEAGVVTYDHDSGKTCEVPYESDPVAPDSVELEKELERENARRAALEQKYNRQAPQ